MVLRTRDQVIAALALGVVLMTPAATTRAHEPRVLLRYTFQPDCVRANLGAACDTPKAQGRLDFGPQIAVWLEAADRSSFVTDLLVTNLTAVRGIGNRPGHWKFPSTWRFPYGKRKMVLPVWAHARGRLYDTLVMQDEHSLAQDTSELAIGFHEVISSPDPYHCLSFMPSSWVMNAETVDAISCPTSIFNSSKGKFVSSTKTPYPPRNDVTETLDRDCDDAAMRPCPVAMRSATRFAEINDLDAVATATPPYGRPFSGVWNVPSQLADGEYALLLEINKEFDNNAHHAYKSYVDPALPDAGFTNNFGQPSVVFRVPIRIDRTSAQQAAATEIAGYGDWDGATGDLHAPDATISDTPGSGRGRLVVLAQPSISGGAPVMGRVHVITEVDSSGVPCDPALAGAGFVTGLSVPQDSIKATQATVSFVEPDDGGKPVERYDIRYRPGDTMDEDTFREAIPAPTVMPETPGATRSFSLADLKPNTRYVVGVRVRGGCIREGKLAFLSFATPRLEFTMLSGCFIATAAYGSPLAEELGVLRRLRDAARTGNPLTAAAVDAYERASPPLAAVLRESTVARAVVRTLLGPVVGLGHTNRR